MSSSYYSRLDSALRSSLMSLVSLDGLFIVSIEFGVTRDKGQPTLLSIDILLSEAEQKPKTLDEIAEEIIEIGP